MPQAAAQQPATPKPGQPALAPATPAQAVIPVPTTRRGIEELAGRAEAIKSQLRDLTVRRRELFEQSQQLPSNRQGDHLSRIAAIDQRAATLERELFMTEDIIAQATRGRLAQGQQTEAPGQAVGGLLQEQRAQDTRDLVREASRQAVFGSAFGLLAMYMLYRGFRRFIWRRKPAPGLPDYGPQMAQLQQSIDVIALEVERISEGQRYVAKVLGDRGALGSGAAEPVSVAQGEGVARRR